MNVIAVEILTSMYAIKKKRKHECWVRGQTTKLDYLRMDMDAFDFGFQFGGKIHY